MEKRVANVSNAYIHIHTHTLTLVRASTSHTKNYFVRICRAHIHAMVRKEEKNVSIQYTNTQLVNI